MRAQRRDVTEAEMRIRGNRDQRLCPDCGGWFWWPWARCLQTVPDEREIGTDDGVVEYVRECPGGRREGRR